MYKRILLKLSGEQLAGDYDFGVDPAIAHYFAEEVKKAAATGAQVIIVIGGGNMVRGAEMAGHGIRRVTADQMGMLSGLINAMALTDIFENDGISTRCLSIVSAPQIAEPYAYRLAMKHLERDRVLLIAGGMARPYFTHDTAAVSYGLELDCDIVIKASKVDGIYDKDPHKHKDARRFDQLTFDAALANDAIKVMDKAALGLAMEQQKSVMVYDAMTPGNLEKICRGETVGTKLVP